MGREAEEEDDGCVSVVGHMNEVVVDVWSVYYNDFDLVVAEVFLWHVVVGQVPLFTWR